MVSLVVGGKLPGVFERRELVTATAYGRDFRYFQFPQNLDEFLRWAEVKKKITQEGAGASTKYRAAINPIEYLPGKAQLYFKDRGLQKFMIKNLLALEDKRRKTILGDDIVTAVFAFTGVTLGAQQILIGADFLIKEGLLERVEKETNFYAITAFARSECGVPQDKLLSASKQIEEEEMMETKEEIPVVSKKPVATLVNVVLTSQVVSNVSLNNLNRLFPLFLETSAGIFVNESKRRALELGFVSKASFENTLVYMRKAGWLILVEPGQSRWNLEKVAPEWIAALKDGKPVQSVQNPPEEIAESEEDNDFVPEEAKELLESSSIPLLEEKLVAVGPTVKEAEAKKLDMLEKQIAETQRQLADQKRINGRLATSIADMMYTRMAELPKEVRTLVLAVLTKRMAP